MSKALIVFAVALCALAAMIAGCGRSDSPVPVAAVPDPCAGPGAQDSINCKVASGEPPAPDEKYVYSYMFFCEKDGDRSRTLNVTYRSSKSCEDAKTQVDRGVDPCTEFATEKWPGWRTWQREPVYDLESCD
jgi:hypothetical protein